MNLIYFGFRLISKLLSLALILAICLPILLVGIMGNQPMAVPQAPKGMTYWGFLSDRMEAAKVVQPARCGWGMMLSLAALGPIYSVVYTEVAIHPHGYLAKLTAPDTDILMGVENAAWYEVPGIWWRTLERLSWTMLAKTHPGCHFRPVAQNGIKSSPLPPDSGRTPLVHPQEWGWGMGFLPRNVNALPKRING